MWLTLTQTDGQKIWINFNAVKLMLPTAEGAQITFTDNSLAYVKERFADVSAKIDNVRSIMRGG